jgi:hypothetical protein
VSRTRKRDRTARTRRAEPRGRVPKLRPGHESCAWRNAQRPRPAVAAWPAAGDEMGGFESDDMVRTGSFLLALSGLQLVCRVNQVQVAVDASQPETRLAFRRAGQCETYLASPAVALPYQRLLRCGEMRTAARFRRATQAFSSATNAWSTRCRHRTHAVPEPGGRVSGRTPVPIWSRLERRRAQIEPVRTAMQSQDLWPFGLVGADCRDQTIAPKSHSINPKAALRARELLEPSGVLAMAAL